MKAVLVGIYDKTTVSLAPQVLKSYISQFGISSDLEEIVTKEFSIFDHPVESAVEGINQERPDVVGFSTYIWNIKEVLDIIKHINATVILGGPQVTGIEKKLMQKNPDIDIIVSGEGEVAFKDLLEYFTGKRKIEEVRGITTKDFRSPPPELIDLDSIPEFYNKIFEENPDLSWINLETSRGCPFGCRFCTWGYDKKMRYFSVERVKRDLDQILSQDNIASIYFCDSSLLLKKPRAREILQHIIDSGSNITARYEFNAEHLDDETIGLLGQLSDHEFNFGLQSTNKNTLKVMGRRFNKTRFEEKFTKVIKRMPKAKVTVDLIYGLPSDDIESYKESLNYAISLENVSRILTNPLIALPGADFFVDRDKYGIKLRDENSYVVRETSTFPEADMEKARKYSFFVSTVHLNHGLRESIKLYADDNNMRYIDAIINFMESLPFQLVAGTYPDMIPSEKEDFKGRNEVFERVIGRYEDIISHFGEFTGHKYNGSLTNYRDKFSDHFYKLKSF